MARRAGVLTRFAFGIALGLAESADPASAQSVEPRTYSPAPVGTNFVIVAAAHAQGPLETDPALPISDFDLKAKGLLLGYSRSLNLFGKSGQFDLVVPYGKVTGTATFLGNRLERDVTGFSDPAARLAILFVGAPTMTTQEFMAYHQDLLVGASVQVSVPVGKYDRDKLLNLGSHRWSIKPELGIAKSWGAWTLETATGVTFFGVNNDFLGNHQRRQKPIYSAQAHLLYNIARGAWVAANLSYFTGGESEIDRVNKGALDKNWRTGIIVAVPITPQLSVKANGSKGVSQRTGQNFSLYGLALQYRWGAGIARPGNGHP